MYAILLTLHGVGIFTERHIERGIKAGHYRRKMTPEEVAALPAKVLATAPIFER